MKEAKNFCFRCNWEKPKKMFCEAFLKKSDRLLYTASMTPDQLHAAGRLALSDGHPDTAIIMFDHAIRQKPREAAYRTALGLALHEAGRQVDAAAAFRHAIRLDKTSFDAHNHLGVTLSALGQPAEAAQSFRRAIALDRTHPATHNNLGNALHALGDHARAAEAYHAAIALDPSATQLHINLATELIALSRDPEAIIALTHALTIDPAQLSATLMLADAYLRAGNAAAAEHALRCAFDLVPNSTTLNSKLGRLLLMEGREAEAGSYFRQALALSPGDPRTHQNYGVWLRETGDLAAAEAQLRAGLAIAPQDASLHLNLSLTLLCMGRLREGLAENEWRWQAYGILPRFAKHAPAWTGDATPDRTLLIMLEQGQGDIIHFLRYVALAAERVRVVLEIPASLRRLASLLPGITLFSPNEPAPPHDMYCPLLSLPHILGLDEAPLGMDPAHPYLRADPAGIARWAARIAPFPGRKIGLVWSGDKNFPWDRRRSIPPALFDALACDNITFISLQKDPVAKPALPLIDWTDELNDFADTAALITNLDLVISVDTAVAHLAGAIGHPIWLLNRFDADWRWLRTGDTSLWYPTLRQFRQPRLGDWPSVIEAVRIALQ